MSHYCFNLPVVTSLADEPCDYSRRSFKKGVRGGTEARREAMCFKPLKVFDVNTTTRDEPPQRATLSPCRQLMFLTSQLPC